MDRKSLPNPFQIDIVTSPEQQAPADVAEIHRQPFEICQQAYESVVRDRASVSVLLSGEAGCGKTHLLSRFRRWLRGDMEASPSLAPALLLALQMETSPRQIWRHVRRRFAEELTRRADDGTCPLDGILGRFAAAHSGSLAEGLDSAGIKSLGLDLAKVLEHFEAGRHRRLCRAWLIGDGLSDADLRALNLSGERLEELEEDYGETKASHVVLAVTRLSAPSPVVFCFDQVEALGISQHGSGLSFAPFSRMGTALIDGCPNVLAISTLLETVLVDLQNGSMRSDYQRISKRAAPLMALNPKQGRALIDSRLRLVSELEGQDPIPESKLRAIYERQHGSCNARRLIHEARRLFAEWQECAPAPSASVPEFLRAEFDRLWADSGVRVNPDTTDAVMAHGLPVALELLGKRATSTDAGVVVDDGGSRTDIVFINHSNMRSLAATLRRLQDRKSPGVSLCLVRDRRLPISGNAKATKERLRNIEQNGGRVVRAEAEALAALDAMRQLLTAATSGDLSLNGETVEARTVRDWLASNLPAETQEFAAALLGETVAPPQEADADALLELVGERKVVSVDEAAQAISWPGEKIESYARAHPLDIRWFGGLCPVVCLAVDAVAARDMAKEIVHGG